MLFEMAIFLGATFSKYSRAVRALKPPSQEGDKNFCHAKDNEYCLVIA